MGVPDAHDSEKRHAPIMFTTDMAMRVDPIYGPISRRFSEDPNQFKDAFARAWYKFTHRDMGPVSRLYGKLVPPAQIWQDPVPDVTHALVGEREIEDLKRKILGSGLSIAQLVNTAWASASTYRATDHRGGANGARIRLAPQKDWEVNNPAELAKVLQTLEGIQAEFNRGSAQISLADLIVLAGGAGIEEAAKRGGHNVKVPFSAGRTDASAEQTDAESFDVLNANTAQSQAGVLTKTPETLTNDFFVNLLDMSASWKVSPQSENLYEARHRSTNELMWTGTRADLVFGSNSELVAIAEYYACDDSKQAFVDDFVAAWVKVMNLDRFDLK